MKSSRMCESWHIGMGSLHLFSGLVLDSQSVWHIMYVLQFPYVHAGLHDDSERMYTKGTVICIGLSP